MCRKGRQLTGSGAADEATLPRGTALAYNAPDGSAACFAGSAGHGFSYWAVSFADETDEQGHVHRHGCHSGTEDADKVKAELLDILHELDTKDECQCAKDLIKATAAQQIYLQRSKQLTTVRPSFCSTDGKVVSVGHAAHAFSPAYGKAANFAFEDAVTLAMCLRDNHADWS